MVKNLPDIVIKALQRTILKNSFSGNKTDSRKAECILSLKEEKVLFAVHQIFGIHLQLHIHTDHNYDAIQEYMYESKDPPIVNNASKSCLLIDFHHSGIIEIELVKFSIKHVEETGYQSKNVIEERKITYPDTGTFYYLKEKDSLLLKLSANDFKVNLQGYRNFLGMVLEDGDDTTAQSYEENYMPFNFFTFHISSDLPATVRNFFIELFASYYELPMWQRHFIDEDNHVALASIHDCCFPEIEDDYNFLLKFRKYPDFQSVLKDRLGKSFAPKKCYSIGINLFMGLISATYKNINAFRELYQYLLNNTNYEPECQEKGLDIQDIIIKFYEGKFQHNLDKEDQQLIKEYIFLCDGKLNTNIQTFKGLEKRHDEYLYDFEVKNLEYFESDEKYNILESNERFTFKYIKNAIQLVEEGVQMRNCAIIYSEEVKNGYSGFYHANITAIKNSGYTIHLYEGEENGVKNIYVSDVVGYKNSECPEELMKEIGRQTSVQQNVRKKTSN